jgi:hypothetical protein
VEFSDWHSIQGFINGNITKFSLEVQGIKTKLTSLDLSKVTMADKAELMNLRNLYFPDH